MPPAITAGIGRWFPEGRLRVTGMTALSDPGGEGGGGAKNLGPKSRKMSKSGERMSNTHTVAKATNRFDFIYLENYLRIYLVMIDQFDWWATERNSEILKIYDMKNVGKNFLHNSYDMFRTLECVTKRILTSWLTPAHVACFHPAVVWNMLSPWPVR